MSPHPSMLLFAIGVSLIIVAVLWARINGLHSNVSTVTKERAELIVVLKDMLTEWDKLTRGSPMAKAANERVAAARALIAKVEAPHAD